MVTVRVVVMAVSAICSIFALSSSASERGIFLLQIYVSMEIFDIVQFLPNPKFYAHSIGRVSTIQKII